jgi:hypothetical protein
VGFRELPLLDEPWKIVMPTDRLLAGETADLEKVSLPNSEAFAVIALVRGATSAFARQKL